jgi:hypothetical protein
MGVLLLIEIRPQQIRVDSRLPGSQIDKPLPTAISSDLVVLCDGSRIFDLCRAGAGRGEGSIRQSNESF